jgi:hypothetical protein
MIELIIERWSDRGATTYLWSVWRDGHRMGMGGPHADLRASEVEARQWCDENLHQPPDRVTPL